MGNHDSYAPVIVGIAVGMVLIMTMSLIFTDTQPLADLNKSLASITVTIPEGASLESNNLSFQPQIARVVLEVTKVRWVNHDTVPARIEADDDTDPAFFQDTRGSVIIAPGESFEFTFTIPGEFSYHGAPWQQGKVIVLRNEQ